MSPAKSKSGKAQSSSTRLFTPANVVTIVRICLVPVFVVALLSPWPEWFGIEGIVSHESKSLIAALLFIVISCTDWIDGYLARSRNEVTDFGKFMDPLADKILVAAALLALVELEVLPSWPVLIILAREFIVSGVRMVAASKGEVIAASWYGKAKTVTQIIAIVLFLTKDSLYLPTFDSVLNNPLYLLSWATMLLALVLTIVSMLDYLVKARHLLGFADSASSDSEPDSISAMQNKDTPCEAREAENIDGEISQLAHRVIEKARKTGKSIGCAESLTGGMIAAALTEVPGSSAVVHGGIVSYVNEIKSAILGVDRSWLSKQGAVNAETAYQMAQGARGGLNVDVAVSVTGIAGPGGEEPGKPVGTVWIATSTPAGTQTYECHFAGNRNAVRCQTVCCALERVYELL